MINTIKLQALFERAISSSNIYLQNNDVKGFVNSIWISFGKDIPAIKERFELSSSVGFKSNEQQKMLSDFATVKNVLDAILIILFEGAVLNTEAGYQTMTSKLLALYEEASQSEEKH